MVFIATFSYDVNEEMIDANFFMSKHYMLGHMHESRVNDSIRNYRLAYLSSQKLKKIITSIAILFLSAFTVCHIAKSI